jgi:hypothetical protein
MVFIHRVTNGPESKISFSTRLLMTSVPAALQMWIPHFLYPRKNIKAVGMLEVKAF